MLPSHATTKDFLHSVWHIWVHQGINPERSHLLRLVEMTRSHYYSPIVNNLKTMLPGLATNLALGLFLVLVNEKESENVLSGLAHTVCLFNDVSQLVEQMFHVR
uniref:Terpene synthase metal-binding domain-containing protein n=1 Tax=Romanomermis culicivorax TaxID=13658 RepID=A0A915JDR2_ROMCU